jgi:SAM-dependent methyltransferase
VTALATAPLLGAVRLHPGTRLLDIATGPGALAAEAANRGARPVGIDLSPQMMELARRLYPGIDFREADVEHLPFADDTFDAVVCAFGLGHFPRPELAVAESVPKGLVRMVKYWNNNPKHGEKPIKPSFLIEVMALEVLHGGFGGSFDREIQSFFATLADRIFDTWPDPAGLGPPISDGMDQQRKTRARDLLRAGEREAAFAIDLARKGRLGDSLKAWRALFGPKFPIS